MKAEVARLQSAKSRFDPRSHTVLNAILAYADVIRAYYERPAQNATNRADRNRALYAAAKQIRDEVTKATAPATPVPR